MKRKISQDVALSIINTIRVKCIKAITNKDNPLSPEVKQEYEERLKVVSYEERVVYGLAGDPDIKESVLDKVVRCYSPEIKADFNNYVKNRSRVHI